MKPKVKLDVHLVCRISQQQKRWLERKVLELNLELKNNPRGNVCTEFSIADVVRHLIDEGMKQ